MPKLKFYDLDKWHSRYVRLRDADENGDVTCCSCGKSVFWKEADAGHFVPRQNKATRYHEKNVFGQCRSCNRFFNGNPAGYSRFLVQRFGFEILDTLILAGHQVKKWTQFEIDNQRDYYKKQAKQLSNEKGLPI